MHIKLLMLCSITHVVCRNIAMIKSSKDTRYAVDSVVTHDGTKYPCWALTDLLSFKQKIGEEAYDKVYHMIRVAKWVELVS